MELITGTQAVVLIPYVQLANPATKGEYART